MLSRLARSKRVAVVGACLMSAPLSAAQHTESLQGAAPPVVEGRWVRPAQTDGPAIPEWGHADGLRIGLAPLPGPRGLLRVYVAAFEHASPKVINYIAVEPTPQGATDRGYSELEPSALDNVQGKRFWSCDTDAEASPASPDRPARGIIETVDGIEQLSVIVGVERFQNGADVCLRLLFRADRPNEVGIGVIAREQSVPLENCVITATMGNYARLRTLELADKEIAARTLWPGYRGNGFTPHAKYMLGRLRRLENGDVIVSATPDEADPEAVELAAGTRPGWRYRGPVLRQTWRMSDPPTGLRACVNGRFTYWASESPIPGGVAFENFELIAPFAQGQTFWFGVEPIDPRQPTTQRVSDPTSRP